MKTTVVRRGNKEYRYLSLVEALREGGKSKHRTLLRLGEASELARTGQLDRIIAALRDHAEGGWISTDELSATDAPALGGIAALEATWDKLSLASFFDRVESEHRLAYSLRCAVFAMVANRLLRPSSKRSLPEWTARDVAMPKGFTAPVLDEYYWAVDQVAQAKEPIESHLYDRLTDLTNLDLSLVCYDLTSTYFCGSRRPSARFASRAFGYSRDHRGDRPQVVIGLLVTGDGIPIAHHVFAGNTADVSTLPSVLDDLAERFGVAKVCLVADRGLISEDNLAVLGERGFDHVLATRLHNSAEVKAVLEAATRPDARWLPVPGAHSAVCEVIQAGRRFVVGLSAERVGRDGTRTAELVARTEKELDALERRVRQGRLKDATKIAKAAGRILARSGIARLFETEVGEGRFLYHYVDEAFAYEEELLAGRYVLATSLSSSQASPAEVLVAYRRLLEVESTFRVLKDVIALRPVYHWTERRVRGHIAICVLAAVIEALMEGDLRHADLRDPDLPLQVLSTRRALRELQRIRAVTIDVGDTAVDVVTRRTALQSKILSALGVDTTSWDRARVR